MPDHPRRIAWDTTYYADISVDSNAGFVTLSFLQNSHEIWNAAGCGVPVFPGPTLPGSDTTRPAYRDQSVSATAHNREASGRLHWGALRTDGISEPGRCSERRCRHARSARKP